MITITLPALIWVLIMHMGTKINHLNAYMRTIENVRVKFKRKRIRPLDCVKCMSGWTAGAYAYFTDPVCQIHLWAIPLYMIGAMAMGYFLERLKLEL